jgi:hypothetical protein
LSCMRVLMISSSFLVFGHVLTGIWHFSTLNACQI